MTPLRILHVANFSWFAQVGKRGDDVGRHYATDRKISAGLVRNGHCVFEFSYRDTTRYCAPFRRSKFLGKNRMNEALIDLAKVFKPHLVVLGHCQTVLPETLARLREQNPALKIAQWWVDALDPEFPGRLRALVEIRAKTPYLDAFLSTTGEQYASKAISPDEKPSCRVLFFPNVCDPGVEVHRAFERDTFERDLIFAAAPAPERAEMISRLQALQDVNVGIFGLKGDLLSGAAFHDAIGASKIGLNYSRLNRIPKYSSARIVQIAGNGAVVLSPRFPEIEEIFAEDEIVCFDGIDHMEELLRKLLADDGERRRIAKAGWHAAHSRHNCQRVAKFIVDAAFGENLECRWNIPETSG